MKSVKIKGKDYIEVNERVKYFLENYKDWAITTEHIILNNLECSIKASIIDDKERVRATGYAFERQDDKRSMVNSTSHVENCETSAVGRALGFLGIGIDTSIASADEVNNAIKNQNSTAPVKTYKPNEPITNKPAPQKQAQPRPKPTQASIARAKALIGQLGLTEKFALEKYSYFKSSEGKEHIMSSFDSYNSSEKWVQNTIKNLEIEVNKINTVKTEEKCPF